MARPAIIFIGFMGAGKSTALQAARRAGLETTEADALMEREFGIPIAAAFRRFAKAPAGWRRLVRRKGEGVFRAREAEVVGTLLEQADGGAIAIGGGSVLSPRIREALERHVVVWLQVDAEEAWRRIGHTDRPLATGVEDFQRLIAERLPLYEALADAVVPMGDRGIVERALPSILALTHLR